MIRRLSCAFSLVVDSAGQSKGACQQEGAPQRKIAAVSSAGAGGTLDEDDLDGMGLADIRKGTFSFLLTFSSMLGFTSSDTTDATACAC